MNDMAKDYAEDLRDFATVAEREGYGTVALAPATLRDLADELDRLCAENAALRGALTDCAADLEDIIASQYPKMLRDQYPSVLADFERDMTIVYDARKVLGTPPIARSDDSG